MDVSNVIGKIKIYQFLRRVFFWNFYISFLSKVWFLNLMTYNSTSLFVKGILEIRMIKDFDLLMTPHSF